VAEGKLREDLLYRLQVFPLHLPPLRERGVDVVLIADEVLKELNRAERTNKTFTTDAHEILMGWHWPGNVRELRNVVQRGYIMADDLIDAACLRSGQGERRRRAVSAGARRSTVAEVERRLMLATLEQCGGIKEKAAQMLGISLKTLYNRLREYESQREFRLRTCQRNRAEASPALQFAASSGGFLFQNVRLTADL
jgi:DNA-binding NtrC family response regulator